MRVHDVVKRRAAYPKSLAAWEILWSENAKARRIRSISTSARACRKVGNDLAPSLAKAKRGRGHSLALGEKNGALKPIFQLTHIARPRMA